MIRCWLICTLLVLFFIRGEYAWSNEALQLTIKTNKSNYKINDEIVIGFTINNQSKKNVQVYFINTYEAENYLSIEAADGNKIHKRVSAIYKWENPSFHLIKPGGKLEKEIRGSVSPTIKSEERELKFKDVVYTLDKANKIRIVGVFYCKKELALEYQKKYYQKVEKEFWIGKIKSIPIVINIE